MTTIKLPNHLRLLGALLLFGWLCLGNPNFALSQEVPPDDGMGGEGSPENPGAGGGAGGGAVGSGGIPFGTPSSGGGGTAGDRLGEGSNPRAAECIEVGTSSDPEAPPSQSDQDCCGSNQGASSLTSPGSGGSTGAGCNSCGNGYVGIAGRPSQSLGNDFLANDVRRIWLPNNRVNNSSFSPGFYSQFDSQLNIYPETTGATIVLFDVFGPSNYQFVDGINGDAADGVFHDLRNFHARELRLVNVSGATVSDVSQAVSAVLDHWNGAKETFQIIDLDASATAQALAGRLSARVDAEGRGVSVTYKPFSANDIANSPDRQWQIDTINDSIGNELTFTYDTVQRSGRWVVSSVVRQDGVDVEFQYNASALTTVVLPDNTQSTFLYGQDAVAQTATLTMTEATKSNRELVFHLTNNYMTLTSAGQAAVINQPTGVLRMIENEEQDVSWMRIPNINPAVGQDFYFLGGNKAIVASVDGTMQFAASWSINTGGGLTEYGTVLVTPGSAVFGAGSGTTQAQLYSGRIPSYVDSTGRVKQFQYDSSGNVTRITYPADNTYEEFAFNSLRQKTRERSRTGDVALYSYDAKGRLLSTQTGLHEQGGQDIQTASYTSTSKEYYPVGHANAGLLKAELGPLYNASQPTLHRTDYEYTAQGRLAKKVEPAATVGGARPQTVFTYNAAGLLAETTDSMSRVHSFVYDSNGRLISTIYPDTSTAQTLYGAAGTPNAGRILKTKDRSGTTTSYSYDSVGRLLSTTTGTSVDANILDGAADDLVLTDVNLQNVIEYSYLDGSDKFKSQVKQNGAVTEYQFDFQNRTVAVKQFPRTGKTLISKKTYLNNELLCDEDPYGRKKYYGYRASDGTLIRTVTGTVPSFSLADFTAVWNLTRSNAANALFVIHDAIRDNDGHLVQIIDGRSTETRFEYDAQGRETKKTEAWGTPIAAVTETVYNAGGNVIEVRAPRYFDSTDTEGYQKAKETWTYNGRGQVSTHTEASGSSIAATESFTYDLAGNQATHTDFAGKIWSTIDDTCCGKSTASKNPLGHGSIRNTDSAGRVVHTAKVADVQDHVANMGSPIDAKTLSESTTLFDSLGRTKASTTWLVALGAVDPASPPIAGLNSVPASNGMTTQYLYDNNLSDGIGLDSATGLSYTKMAASGSSSVSLTTAITKLAAAETTGGAEITFSATAPGRASVVINAQDEVSFSISDGAGRTVMSGQLDNYTGTANILLTWSCQFMTR